MPGRRDRFHAWLATRGRGASTFAAQPEPRSTGDFARGRQLLAGNLLFAGELAETGNPWVVLNATPAFYNEIHGFAWLDDLAAVGDARARHLAQDWTWDWLQRYGAGQGPGWWPDLTGRRLIRLVHHALFLLRGQQGAAQQSFFAGLGHQAVFLARRWKAAPQGLPRIEALCGLICAVLALKGLERRLKPALAGLERELRGSLATQGGIASRNPEDLLTLFCLLAWTAQALEQAGLKPAARHRAALESIAPTLRRLRMGNGALARFHGGGPGPEGWLDLALGTTALNRDPVQGMAMGFARLQSGRSAVVIDADAPPTGPASRDAHASTLAFELTSGRRPVIVNCGTGRHHGPDWHRAGRATPGHSTLCLDGASSSRLGKRRGLRALELAEVPRQTPHEIAEIEGGVQFEGGHDGYRRGFGLTHARKLALSRDGRQLRGEDMLLTLNDRDKRLFDRALKGGGKGAEDLTLGGAIRLGLSYKLRFHLHPDVVPALDMGGSAISLRLGSGETWVFRPESAGDGTPEMKIEPSVYLEKGRLKPAGTKQIVLSGRAMEYATRIRWSFVKAQDSPVAIRDVRPDMAQGPVTEGTDL